MSYSEHQRHAPRRLRVAILTASDSRTLATDDSGRILERALASHGHRVVERRVVPDDVAAIRKAARALLAPKDTAALIVNGGTGASPRDVTPEALRPLFVREFLGFGERFRALSAELIGSGAYLSRATLGLVKTGRRLRPVFLVPGSPEACELAARDLIAPELGHLVDLVSGGRYGPD